MDESTVSALTRHDEDITAFADLAEWFTSLMSGVQAAPRSRKVAAQYELHSAPSLDHSAHRLTLVTIGAFRDKDSGHSVNLYYLVDGEGPLWAPEFPYLMELTGSLATKALEAIHEIRGADLPEDFRRRLDTGAFVEPFPIPPARAR